MAKKWKKATAEEIEFIHANYLKMPGKEIARRLGWSPRRVYNTYKREGLVVPEDVKARFRTSPNKVHPTAEQREQMVRWTKEGKAQRWIGHQWGLSPTVIRRWQKEAGLSKYLRRNARNNQFKPGIEVWNKGIPRDQWMDKETLRRVKKNQFQKGDKPSNTEPIGTVTIRSKSGKKESYKYIKTGKNRWELYHRHLYEEAHGPIPENHMILFRDGDQMNCTLDNLKMITRHENMIRNSHHDFPEEVIDTVVLQGRLKKKINEIKENHGNKK